MIVKAPLACGVPLTIPVLEFRVRPDGKLVALQPMGAFPPADANASEYARLIAPLGKAVVVIVNGPTIVNDNGFVVLSGVGPVESVTVTETSTVPTEVVDPVIAPEVALMVSPEGSPVALHLSGLLPPEAVTVVLYAAPDSPLGRDALVMFKAAAMVKESCLVAV